MTKNSRLMAYVLFISVLGVVSALLAGRGEEFSAGFWPLLAFVFVPLFLTLLAIRSEWPPQGR